MSTKDRTALQKMDGLVGWTGAAKTVKNDMSSDAGTGRRHRPMRWLPLLPIACGAGLVAATIAAPVAPAVYAMAGPMVATVAAISLNGPLGKPSIDDDEREAALRKDAFLFCVSVLAFLNIVGGPILMLTAALQGWTVERVAGIAFALFIANAACFGGLPTLYASWKSPKLPGADD